MTAAAFSSSLELTPKFSWLIAEIARDARGYVLTGDDLKKAGRLVARPRSLSS